MKKNYCTKKVNELQSRAENNPHDKNILLGPQRARSHLKKIMLIKTKGAIMISKVRWHEEGERNTKYFYSLEYACPYVAIFNPCLFTFDLNFVTFKFKLHV